VVSQRWCVSHSDLLAELVAARQRDLAESHRQLYSTCYSLWKPTLATVEQRLTFSWTPDAEQQTSAATTARSLGV
jgi:hypothetical protein